MALPRLRPGKSVRVALLPEGQDPDDLARSGGREALADVLAGARPLAEMLWAREADAASLDTPERRAAFEARIHELVRSIGDESVRKYYGQDFATRLRQLFTPQFDQGRSARPRGTWGQGPPYRSGGGFRDFARNTGKGWQPARAGMREAQPQPSSQLSGSPLVRGFRSVLSPREALMLLAVVNHPWLLEHHAEAFAALEFLNPNADQLRRAILDAVTGGVEDSESLRAVLAERGLSAALARVEAAITHTSDWPARAGAGPDDVGQWWSHVVTLHRKQRTLNRELKDAERALGEEPTDANLAWLRDVQGRLSALDGTEALIEGFGLSSGRPARSL
jgi:DNA primase